MYAPIPLHSVVIGDYVLTPENTIWIIDCEESLANIPQVDFFYHSLGENGLLAFKTFQQANFWYRRN
jgi:hypothetical protein